jgi:2-oxoglutarate ferredoxin oxidoreductase subunit beta
MGDGDGATIGGNHLIHTARRNMDITGILVNNYNYGMTGGQNSATTPAGSFTSTTVYGNPEPAFDICSLVAAAGANYVARETVANGARLKARIKEALSCEGFGFVEAIGPCTTLFGPKNSMKRPVEMIRWLKEKGVSPARFDAIEGAAAKGYFTVGKLVERDKPGFVAMYGQVRERARGCKEQ